MRNNAVLLLSVITLANAAWAARGRVYAFFYTAAWYLCAVPLSGARLVMRVGPSI